MALYISLIISYLRHSLFHSEMVLVGSECNVRWSWESTPEIRIISFAPERVDNSPFDDYGWSDEAFMNLPDLRSLLRFIQHGKRNGHEFASVSLIYADIAE
jgi:hypothetical protein